MDSHLIQLQGSDSFWNLQTSEKAEDDYKDSQTERKL